MKQATITLPEELDEALDAYGRDHGVNDPLGSVIEDALRDFLGERGYLARPQEVVSIEHDSNETESSIDHDWCFVSDAESLATLPFRPFHVTPLHREDGPTDISEHHDRYFADGETSGSG